MKYLEIKDIARRLRTKPTESEKLLWEHLRKRQLGDYRFLRQHPLYYENVENDHYVFIPDFYCSELKLIIELDGEIHQNQRERDEKREMILRSKGFKILRIKNVEVNDIELLKERILSFIHLNCKN